MKKNLTLSRWIIEKTDGDAYRAGRLQGEKHPSVDQRLINTLGGRANLLNQAKEMEDEDWFRCLYAIAQIKNPVWKRVFSAKIFRDSKKFENVYEDRVITVLRNYLYPDKQDAMSDEEVLKEAGILTETCVAGGGRCGIFTLGRYGLWRYSHFPL